LRLIILPAPDACPRRPADNSSSASPPKRHEFANGLS
jgi:hypothetical protein